MKITLKRHNDFLIIKILELPNMQLDLTNIKIFKKKLIDSIPKKEKHIILDLENISYIDSSIIGLFVDLFNNYRNNQGTFGLLHINDKVYKILELVNLTKFIQIYKSIDNLKK